MATLCFLSIGYPGHVYPFLPLAGELRRRGHRVIYFATEELAPRIRELGLESVVYSSTLDRAFVPAVAGAPTDYLLRSVREARAVLPRLEPLVSSLAPDALLYDGACLAGRVLASSKRLPAVKLCPSFASSETIDPFTEENSTFLADSELRSAFFREVTGLLTDWHLGPLDPKAAMGHAERLNVAFMTREFQIHGDAFDDRFCFAGASLRDEPETEARSLELPQKDLLYVSFGTMAPLTAALLSLLREALEGSRWQVLLAGADSSALGSALPPGWRAHRHVPQLSVLRRASVFLTHAGMNSVQESLHYGVPLVTLAHSGEHALIARRVGELGLGVRLDRASVTAPSLRNAIELAASDPAIRQRVDRMAALSREAGGFRKAAEAIEAYLA